MGINKHTPGPWVPSYGYIRPAQVDIVHGNGVRTESKVVAYAVLPSNLDLICAAPDLLEALIECVDVLKLHGYGSCDGVAWGDAAIAKAEGRMG